MTTILKSKHFAKCDRGFVCQNCGHAVPPLLTSSRDHCTRCLYSMHVDINPGDRENNCHGMLRPIAAFGHGRKGLIIRYHCTTCGDYHNCKSAPDDDFDEILKLF